MNGSIDSYTSTRANINQLFDFKQFYQFFSLLDQFPELPKKFGMVWRFAPMADPLVEEWHSRDLDSRISHREVSAVNDWKSTGRTYHIMRDHPQHGTQILGGMFGMRKNNHHRNQTFAFQRMLDLCKLKWEKGLDQWVLNQVVWPLARHDMVAHDSYLCNSYPSEFNRPYPTQRINGPNYTNPGEWNYIGSNGGTFYLPDDNPCPIECRPAVHQDWLLC